MKLAGRGVLVTGGAVRVGRAIALAMADRGAHVGLTYLTSEEAAGQTQAELRARGVRAHAVRCDQRDPRQVEAAVRETAEALGSIDVLVNSAAIFRRTPFAGATLEDWDAHLEINLRGPWLFARSAAPGMRERGEGVILNLLDIAGDRPYPAYLPYCASKAGLASLTRGLARALAPEVRVNGIAIGTVLWPEDYPEDRKRTTVARTPLQRTGTPEEVAAAAVFLVEDAGFVTGAILPLDGGRSLT